MININIKKERIIRKKNENLIRIDLKTKVSKIRVNRDVQILVENKVILIAKIIFI